jgi:prepilin-type N-terminal cleavage/methylation domain-containing protein
MARSNKRRATGASAGFSLLETLIALAIAGMVVSAFYQTIAVGMRLEQASREYADRVLVAARVLDDLGSAHRLAPGRTTGSSDDGKLGWELDITADPSVETPGGTLALVQSVRVTITVAPERDDGSAPFVLETLRVLPEVMP